MRTVKLGLKELILSQFEPDIAVPLLEFGKSLSKLDADVLIFMARKSLCLYDVLLRLGIKPAEQLIVSDRVLDMRLDPLVGKKVALIDDTVIVGTTLAKTKRILESSASAKVTVHTFCLDKDWWCNELLRPDSVSLELSDERLMTFCTAEVRAISLLPRPYLVDFPISRPIRIRTIDSHALLSSIEWDAHNISSKLQERNGVTVLTFFPSEPIISELASGIGEPLKSCLEILKVRAFLRNQPNTSWMRIVPIVTLRPMNSADIDRVSQYVFARVSQTSGENLTKLAYYANSARARQRLIQYALSAALGWRFMESLKSSVGDSVQSGYDLQETDRHFGPWIHHEMSALTQYAFGSLWAKKRVVTSPSVAAVSLPHSLHGWIRESLADHGITKKSSNGFRLKGRSNSLNFVTEMTENLLHLYDTKELPARREARLLGTRILDATPEEAPNRDRLDVGIPWNSLIEHICREYNVQDSESTANLLSLALDLCNDLGIAVPITCVREGVVFRAYRHGEDVKFSDAELVLAYEAVRGVLDATSKRAVPRLVLEKLLVILIRVGAARGFLEPLYGTGGADGSVRIGFNLKGAIPVLVRGPKDFADKDIWLSQYLTQRGVLKISNKGQYVLGQKIEGNYLTPTAPDDAYEIGNIVGMLLKSAKFKHRAAAPLDDSALTLIATCWHPRHTAAALQVELDIFRRWYEVEGGTLLKAIEWDDPSIVECILKNLVSSVGYEAVHSARLKYVGFRTGQPQKIVKDCTAFLRSGFRTELLARRWEGYWNSLDGLKAVREEEVFNPLIDQAGALCWIIAASLSAIEFSLAVHLEHGTNSQEALQSIQKLQSYSDSMRSAGLADPPVVSTVIQRFSLERMSQTPTVEFRQMSTEALCGISEQLPAVAQLVETIGPVVEDFGRFWARHDYAYMVWFDVRDSTGEKAGHKGRNLENYRIRVRNYKGLINRQLHSLTILAKKDNCQVFCWNGHIDSTNDEKHVFFSGEFALRHVCQAITSFLSLTGAWRDINVRIHVVPCGFAGTSAYRVGFNTEVEGERFWEHWSRVKKTCATLEMAFGDDASVLFVVGEGFAENFKLPEGIVWIHPQMAIVKSEIELLSRDTPVRYGVVRMDISRRLR